jgi:hypothetical protein
MVLLIYAELFRRNQVKLSLTSFMAYFVLLLLLVLVSYVAWFTFERHTVLVRDFFSSNSKQKK